MSVNGNKIGTSVFTAVSPEGFSVVRQLPASVVAVAEAEEDSIQPPRITISVSLQSAYEVFGGSNFKERFFNALPQRRFKAVVVNTTETLFNGSPCYIVHGKTDVVFNEQHYHLFYFVGCILINDEYCLEFIGEAEENVRAGIEPLINEAWLSLQWNNDADALKQSLQEQEDAVAATLKAMEERLEINEDEAAEGTAAVPEVLPFEIPAGGKEVFEIGGISFDIIEEESKWEIPGFSKELNTHIVARTGEVKKAVEARLLEEYTEGDEATVHIDFPGIGIYGNGIPEGSFEITGDKCEATYAYVRKEGFEYGLDFFGTITFKDNWVAYNGYLKRPYDDVPCFPVKIYKQFNADTLDWSNYKFTSYEETLQAPAEVVCYLDMANPEFEEFPERLFSFSRLKELGIICKWPLEKLPLRSFPAKIGSLQMLEQVSVNGVHVESLPESIGQLTNLTRFYFNNGQLKTIPEGLLQLPKLEYLVLSRHQLEALPQQAHLPEIKTIDLSGNQLKTLPETLLQQPKLKRVDIKNNPLEILPASINQIADVELSIEDKMRLMDFTYKGADGTGVISWNDRAFYAAGDPDLDTRIEALIREYNAAEYREAIGSLAKKSIAFSHAGDEDYTIIGNHRFGGMPDLPADMDYPKFIEKREDGEKEYLYEFIGQVNCGAIAGLQDYLPRKGILFFFFETIHNLYGSTKGNPCKVIYAEDTSALSSGSRFNFSADDYFEMYDPAYAAYSVHAAKEMSFPSFYASYQNSYLFKGAAKALQDKEELLDDTLGNLYETGANSKPYAYAMNAYGFTQHESPELQASLKQKGNPEDWIILLKVSSAGDFQWGDAGDLFFVIHKSDLAKKDFSNVFVTLESS